MNLFNFTDYHDFLRAYLKAQPKGGFGMGAKMAKAMGINPSIVTQVLQGSKEFTMEQAHDLCESFAMNDLEQEYFLLLVQFARAGKKNLREHLRQRIQKMRERAQELKEIMPPKKEMSEESKALFYSNWYYSGVRILSAVDGFDSVDQISDRLQLPKKTVAKVVDFLVSQGLCAEKNGKLTHGTQSTHVGNDSLLVNRHHANWRLKAIERMNHKGKDELFFTSPMALAKKDIPKVKEVLSQAIESSFKIIEPSDNEELACLNIDWFQF